MFDLPRALCTWRQAAACLLLSVVCAGTAAAQSVTISRVADINPGMAGSGPSYLTVYDDALYFRANDQPSGNDAELWRYDGNGAQRAADVYPGLTGSSPADLAAYNGYLYFAATGSSGKTQLYRYDGTAASLAPGSASQAGNPQEMFVYGGNLYFRAFRSDIGIELWKFDGTNQTPINMFPGAGSSYPQHFIEYNGLMHFNACGQAGQGTELWQYGGSGTPTCAATIYPNNGSSPEWFVVHNGALYFSAYDGVHGRELWRFDACSALLIADILAGGQYSSSNPNNMAVYKDEIYFSADDGVHGYELWKFDGNAASMVAEINPTPDPGNGDTWMMDSSPSGLTVFDDVLYFSADDGVHGRELWASDGESVWMVADIYPGQYGSDVSEFQVYRDSLYFSANDGDNGGELGVSDTIWRMTAIPEPASLALLGLGALALLRRHR